MIGLVRLRPPASDGSGTLVLDRLPPAPAERLAGAMIRCDGEADLTEALSWYAEVRGMRKWPDGLRFACDGSQSASPGGVKAVFKPSRLPAPAAP